LTIDAMMLLGGYPLLHSQPIMASDWFASYVATYIERDVRQVLNVQDMGAFQRFLRLCAGRSGQLLNLSTLAGEAGISHSTARAWLSVLESSDLVFLLPPYHRNFGKRLVKTPKLYFLDSGLACWLLGVRSPEVLALHPSRGALFETWVVGEFVKGRFNLGLPTDLYFWRDNNGLEADLIFEVGARLQPVEIKSGQTVTRDYLRAGQASARFAGGEALPTVAHLWRQRVVRAERGKRDRVARHRVQASFIRGAPLMVTVATHVAQRLAASGHRHVFLVTGGGAMFLNDALCHQECVTPVFFHHEQAAAMAAIGNMSEAVVIDNGDTRWKHSPEVFDLIQPHPAVLTEFQPKLKFWLLDEGRFSADYLEGLQQVMAAIFRMDGTYSQHG
jgi:hypothetical protein